MKEGGRIQGNPELTTKALDPTLETGGIFMSEQKEMPDQGDQKEKPDKTPQKRATRAAVIRTGLRQKLFGKRLGVAPEELQQKSRQAWQEHYQGEKLLPGEWGIVESIIRAGGFPKGWEDKAESVASETLQKKEQEISAEQQQIQDDLEKVFDITPQELTPEAREFFAKLGESDGEMPVDAESLKRMLSENGVSPDYIEKYAGKPAVLVAMLGARAESWHSKRRNEIKPSNEGDEPEEAPVETSEEIVIQDQPEITSLLTELIEDQDQAETINEEQRRRNFKNFRDKVASTIPPDALDAVNKGLAELGVAPIDKEELIDAVLPRNMEERTATHTKQRKNGMVVSPEIARIAWDPYLSMEGLTEDEYIRIDKLIAAGQLPPPPKKPLPPIEGGSDTPPPPYDEHEEWKSRAEAAEDKLRKIEQPIYVPQSLEQLAKLVEDRAGSEYRRDRGDGLRGDKCLFKEDGSVDTVNFLDWFRQNYYLVHLANPTSEVNFFSDIATNVRTEGIGSTISTYEITFTDSYFQKEVRKEDGTTGLAKDADYLALKEQMLMEVFLLQINRNPAVNHVHQTRPEREKMIQGIAAAFILNPYTRDDFFERQHTDPSMVTKSLRDADPRVKDKMIAKREGNFDVGTATRMAEAVYININDYIMLEKILGEDSVLFNYFYDEYEAWEGKKLEGTDKAHTAEDPKDKKVRKEKWFDEHGKLKKYKVYTSGKKEGMYVLKKDENGKEQPVESETGEGLPHPDFMEYLNIFTSPSPDSLKVMEVRERIRLAIMQKTGISFREAQIAELKAHSFIQLNGVAARNDIESVAYDWWTRPQNFEDKRKREKAERRKADYGSEYNLYGAKRLVLNFYEAARDRKGRSIRKVIQGGEGLNVHIEDDPLKNKVDFEWDYKKDGDGNILFRDKSGAVTTGPTKVKIASYRYVDKKGGKFSYLDEAGNEVDLDEGLSPVKESLVLRNNEGEIVDIGVKVTGYAIGKDGSVKFIDQDGNDVTDRVGENRPNTTVVRVNSVVFDTDIQRQYVPNHMITGAATYQWVFADEGYNMPGLIETKNAWGDVVTKKKEVTEIKHGIDHDVRYMYSTWQYINFAERHREWEQVEERDPSTRLLKGTIMGVDGKPKDVLLDEDWYILERDVFGQLRRTKDKGEPTKHKRIREMSRLENMFEAPALKFIWHEIQSRGIGGATVNGEEDWIHVEDPRTGEIVDVNIAGARSRTNEFRIAVAEGYKLYLKAAEVNAHRDFGSGYKHYAYGDNRDWKDALIQSGLATPAQVDFITKMTDTGDNKVFAQTISAEIANGGLEGILKALAALAKATVAES